MAIRNAVAGKGRNMNNESVTISLEVLILNDLMNNGVIDKSLCDKAIRIATEGKKAA